MPQILPLTPHWTWKHYTLHVMILVNLFPHHYHFRHKHILRVSHREYSKHRHSWQLQGLDGFKHTEKILRLLIIHCTPFARYFLRSGPLHTFPRRNVLRHTMHMSFVMLQSAHDSRVRTAVTTFGTGLFFLILAHPVYKL